MTVYTVKFNYGDEVHQYTNPDSPENRTKDTNPEILKDLAAMLIRAYHAVNPDLEEKYPSKVQLFRGDECILACDDLTEKSINRVN